MASAWYYQRNGEQCGPVSSAQLREIAAVGGIALSDLIWKEGMVEWVPATKIAGLFANPSKASAPPVVRASSARNDPNHLQPTEMVEESIIAPIGAVPLSPFADLGGENAPRRLQSRKPKASNSRKWIAVLAGAGMLAIGATVYLAPWKSEHAEKDKPRSNRLAEANHIDQSSPAPTIASPHPAPVSPQIASVVPSPTIENKQPQSLIPPGFARPHSPPRVPNIAGIMSRVDQIRQTNDLAARQERDSSHRSKPVPSTPPQSASLPKTGANRPSVAVATSSPPAPPPHGLIAPTPGLSRPTPDSGNSTATSNNGIHETTLNMPAAQPFVVPLETYKSGPEGEQISQRTVVDPDEKLPSTESGFTNGRRKIRSTWTEDDLV